MNRKASSSFELLSRPVQKWIWKQSWQSLQNVQELSIPIILPCNSDVIISAATASGKTEAAFLPICSNIEESDKNGFQVLCVSPLKALINDQYMRLSTLFECVGKKVVPWHGDIGLSIKKKGLNKPDGLLLITPESLEAMFINKGSILVKLFSSLKYVVVDEFHAFLGTERGRQLMSLLHRLESLIGRVIPRIALSATLGNLELLKPQLRSYGDLDCKIIHSELEKHDLYLQIKGYLNKGNSEGEIPSSFEDITNHIYSKLRGKSNLIFANSKTDVELLAVKLKELCESKGVPNEFFPHHGNLSKDFRESVEDRLKNSTLPTSAVCTSTLELGIDIGSVDTVAQVGVPGSVSSLRQRLGRSGRQKDIPSILRIYVSEEMVDIRSSLFNKLRMMTCQSIAVVELMLQKWFEPSIENKHHYSTLVQQVLSVIAQHGGADAQQVWLLLCKSGPFKKVDSGDFATFLRGLAEREIIKQMNDGTLVLDLKGERLLNHYSFYSAFNTPEEYTLKTAEKTLGSIPIIFPLFEGDYIVFAARRWKVITVDEEKKEVFLSSSVGGAPRFGGGFIPIHKRIRQKMYQLYCEGKIPRYLDSQGARNFSDGCNVFKRLNLMEMPLIENSSGIETVLWLGDDAVTTLSLILRHYDIEYHKSANVFEFKKIKLRDLISKFKEIFDSGFPRPEVLLEDVENLWNSKHDMFVSRPLLLKEFTDSALNYMDVEEWLGEMISKYNCDC